jgi:hypothetical protein
MVNGPRQCGKATMVRGFASKNRTYVALHDQLFNAKTISICYRFFSR